MDLEWGEIKSGFFKNTVDSRIDKYTVLKLCKSNGDDEMKTIKRRKSESTNTDDVAHEWLSAARAEHIPISGPIHKDKGLQVTRELEVEHLKASNFRPDKFHARYNISIKDVLW